MEKRQFILTLSHQLPGMSSAYLGLDIFQITDLQILIIWWNKIIQFAGPVNQIKDRKLAELQTAVWQRINQLVEDPIRFEDITIQNLIKKVA